jgi:hypothetical protein
MREPEFLIYQSDDGQMRLEVPAGEETVWLSQAQMATLFERDQSVIARHLRNIGEDGELILESNMQKMHIAKSDKPVAFYNLDVIISVGYRVKSNRGTQFRIWATQQLREFLVKGFLLNDDRFREGESGRYFEELLQRIRDIRSSEKVFWRKVLDIYATSTDYDPQAEPTKRFFATIQNKMHWAAHGHTAAEIVVERVDADKPDVGMTNFPGGRPLKRDVVIAKNYLTKEELEALNLIVSLYLDFAELQAMSRKLMSMADWISKLDDFLRLSERGILDHAGKASREQAEKTATLEYEKYRSLTANSQTRVERDFDEAIRSAKQLESGSNEDTPEP